MPWPPAEHRAGSPEPERAGAGEEWQSCSSSSRKRERGRRLTYTNIESAPSFHPSSQKKYCDITGLPAPYTDPKTRLRYHNKEVFGTHSDHAPERLGRLPCGTRRAYDLEVNCILRNLCASCVGEDLELAFQSCSSENATAVLHRFTTMVMHLPLIVMHTIDQSVAGKS